MSLKAVTLKEIERIFEVIERFGISREAVVIPLRPAVPGGVEMLKNGKLQIVVDAEQPFEEYLTELAARIGEILGREES
jgi:hypothetical protein